MVRIRNVEILMVPHRVLVYQNLLEPLQIVNPNVLLIANALTTWLVLIKNVKIHARAYADKMRNVKLSVILLIAFVSLDILETHCKDVMLKKV